MKKIECVIMDWAGTAVDFGCFAPLNAFLRVFGEQGVEITYRQAREPMGLLKIEHIKGALSGTCLPRWRISRRRCRGWWRRCAACVARG